MTGKQKPPAAGNGSGVHGCADPTKIERDNSRPRAPRQQAPGSHTPKARWRREALRKMKGKARPCAIVAVLPVAMDDSLRTLASNDWLMFETSLDKRSVAYALADLVQAGLIKVEIKGPRRTITALPPPAEDAEKGAQVVHPRTGEKGARSERKARTSCSPIEGRSSPKPPRNEFQRSVALAAARERAPFVPGSLPAWMQDDEPADRPQHLDQTAPTPSGGIAARRPTTLAEAETDILRHIGGGSVEHGKALAKRIHPDVIWIFSSLHLQGDMSPERLTVVDRVIDMVRSAETARDVRGAA